MKITITLILLVLISACSKEPSSPTPEEIARKNAKAETEAKEKSDIATALNNATEKELLSLLTKCKLVIENESANQTKFGTHLVNEYSSDKYQALAFLHSGNSAKLLEKDIDRVRNIKTIDYYRDLDMDFTKYKDSKALELKNMYESHWAQSAIDSLNTSYPVIVPKESFDGITDNLYKYICIYNKSLEVEHAYFSRY